MAKVQVARVKLQLPGGQATAAPPVGPAIAPHGVYPGDFVSRFNERTKDLEGTIVSVVVNIYQDRTFDIVIKSSPAPVLLKQAAGIAKGSGLSGRETVGKVTKKQVEEIASAKMKDLGAGSLDAAVKMIEGTAKSMGIEVAEEAS
ncbi:MAG: 50S ribosomal protein L11 [Planctomycetes bacterium DG_23]|nr:MAG: 50S ribosomal protein L11 [Planctomycetes bacterium DG_23]